MAKADKKTRKLKAEKAASKDAVGKKGKGKAKATGAVKAPPPVSPLAPASFPALPPVDGVLFATGAAGVRYANRTDVMLVDIAPGSTVAGVFTRSATRSAAVLDCQDKIAKLSDRHKHGFAIVVNSGNANTFTGARGASDVAAISEAAGRAVGIPADHVFTSSTGVIGEPLPASRITDILPELVTRLAADRMQEAARAIMTTDTFPKGAAEKVEIAGKTVTIAGIAKGSGMIAPDMATMLAYVFTDANVTRDGLQSMLSAATRTSFNAITVDSDTSTSDTVLLVATGRAHGVPISSGRSAEGRVFAAALDRVMRDLALQIVRDGEGATKLVEVRVSGAKSARDADKVARAIANSPLVKTAIAGEDPNWGRVVMAVGKSGAAADRDLLSIRFGEILVAEKGWVAESYREKDGADYMKGQELTISVDLGLGRGEATVWTCDFTSRYIEINADYRS
ncbi:bifunctional glutamate N-acetyltransferase/amino-acid acetyltransferase ArgJ [Roseibacterium sp. SDUM158017]|uniref:bifunctional glutamate N-acetyltransferase/amino-acid acetyltransferase ArgJ n=1 Tax=Roseicyclus salinarum TaxID=3036773 RepID=UPI002415005F|nr:bifunctional glutamate N-acetyltransferase/amino-acid acetyltransferase ArgJ [Roseibacterium sp. SDUM158017]MDG4647039.1 bifunctional glutamate N-acetyltransferase/amino-acid acetyltransferase ArgJ [Roseibacterium sp. SDUM158017]